MSRPKAWKHYIEALKKSGKKPDQMLATFAARYKLASSLEGIVLQGYSESTRNGYLVATKVAYAYSALEALERAIGSHESKAKIQIVDFRVAAMLERGELTALLAHIVDSAEADHKKKVEAKLETTLANLDSGNVRHVVEGIRNSLFHGKFTPTASGLASSKARREIFDKLATEILLTADDRFATWLKTQGLFN
jgi:hypothetical protein